MHPMLNIAVRAARRAGTIINRASLDGSGMQVKAKRMNDFVTETDRAAEASIIEAIRKAYPEHAILAEEAGEMRATPEAAGEPEDRRIIAPLDGTPHFIHGFPQSCVSIAGA